MDIFNHYLPWTQKRISLLSPETWNTLFKTRTDIQQDQKIPITNLVVLLFNKLNPPVDLTLFKNRVTIVNWYLSYGRSIFNIDSLEASLNQNSPITTTRDGGGVNLVGYSRGRLGLGEDIRGYMQLLDSKKIPYCVVHIGHPTDDPNQFNHPSTNSPIYDKSIFFLNGIEIGKLIRIYPNFSATFGRSVLIPPWELNICPTEWANAFSHFEHIWGISKFTTAALQTVHNDVKYSPPIMLPVAQRPASNQPKNKRKFRFLFIFDVASYMARKNPIAVIQAFQHAFPKNTDVELILKVANEKPSSSWEEIEKLSKSDCRIKIINKLMTSQEINELWVTADCYLSFHKSEGFGRTIAEALLRNIPVIATGWSGSNDLFPENYPFLVSFELTDVMVDEYPFSQGAVWADISIEDAVNKLQQVYERKSDERLTKLIESARLNLLENFGLDAKRNVLYDWLSN
ncbi:glycosyltransferase [Glaciecola sp. 1036]|uniref:glycosyltransferase n=1 Tax=Alteromonadaceae TaxID=72275 RepID=UPI003CFF7AC6